MKCYNVNQVGTITEIISKIKLVARHVSCVPLMMRSCMI